MLLTFIQIRICLLLSVAVLCLVGCATTSVPSAGMIEREIRAVPDRQASEWNQGDIPAFMETYVRSGSLRFSSGGDVKRGWQQTLERYQRRYPNRDAMGQLQFEDLEIQILSDQWAEAYGRYRLKRGGDYPDATGLFTLLLQRTSDGWKILHDHTSAAESD